MRNNLIIHYLLNGMPFIPDQIIEYDGSGNLNNINASITLNNFIANTIAPSRYTHYFNFNNNGYLFKDNLNFNSNTWSISIWYYITTVPSSEQRILYISKGNDNNTNKKILIAPNSNSTITIKIENASNSTLPLVLNKWTHICLTCDGTTGKIYQNGELFTSIAISTIINDCQKLSIGKTDNATTPNLSNCNLSDFRMYNICLTAAQVIELFNMGK